MHDGKRIVGENSQPAPEKTLAIFPKRRSCQAMVLEKDITETLEISNRQQQGLTFEYPEMGSVTISISFAGISISVKNACKISALIFGCKFSIRTPVKFFPAPATVEILKIKKPGNFFTLPKPRKQAQDSPIF